MNNMKLPFIEGYSDNSINQYNYSYEKRNLNNFKALKDVKNNSFNTLKKNVNRNTMSLQCINLRKNSLKEKLKRISSVSDVEPITINRLNINSIKSIKVQKNKTIFNKMNSQNSDNNLEKNKMNSDEYIPQLINRKPNILNNRNNKKLILPIASNKLNQLKIKNQVNDDSKKENDVKYIFNGVKDKIIKNNFHEYDIKFKNSFLRNINWNNNVLKKIFRNKKIILNMEVIKNFKTKKKNESKEKEAKELSVLKNINNFYDNSYFNSEINNFYNNCKYKNKKLILSMKRNDSINSNNRIYLDRFNDFRNNNFIPSFIEHKKIPKHENKRNSLLYANNKSNSSNVSFNSKYKI